MATAEDQKTKFSTPPGSDRLHVERGLLHAWMEGYDDAWDISPDCFWENHSKVARRKTHSMVARLIQDRKEEGKEFHYGSVLAHFAGTDEMVSLSAIKDIPSDYGEFYAQELLRHCIHDKRRQGLSCEREVRVLEQLDSKEKLIEVWKPSQFREYEPPKDFVLAGDHHLTRGNLSVIGGWPGVGKSRAVMGLAVAGATGQDWMGLEVHSRFKTLILQVENGDCRMRGELEDIGSPDGVDLDDWLRVSRIPLVGLDFESDRFRREVRELIEEFEPGVFAVDAWNRVAADDKVRDYKAALDSVYSCLPNDPGKRPALVVVHHMRKKTSNHNRRHGRDLLHELSGSYSLGSAARSVFALEPVTADTTDDRLVFTCCKNNDGMEGEPSAWHRRNGLFDRVEDFDWDELNSDEGATSAPPITRDDVKNAIGVGGVTKGQAVRKLVTETGKGKSSAYAAINKFNDCYEEDTEGQFYWTFG